MKNLKRIIKNLIVRLTTIDWFDFIYLHSSVPIAKNISHDNWIDYLVELIDKEGMRVLEIGSREVVNSSLRNKFKHAEYIGFDYYSGDNVDVVGDVHKLSTYFDKKFDLIFSSAVFEHLAMPWIASEEIVKMLNVGGYVFVETHYSFSSHERPWHFFQFSENALKVLFNPMLGIQCIEAGCSNPIAGRFTRYASKYLRNNPVTGLYCHSEFLGQKVREVSDFDWKKVSLSDIVSDTVYPKPIDS